MTLNPFRIFDPEPQVRQIAFELYSMVRDLPLISPHGHVEPRLLAENKPFPNPTELILIPDHYIYRLLYSQGIPLATLGIPTLDGSRVEQDPRKIWQIFADNFYLFAGTPTGIWLTQELEEVFGISEKLTTANGQKIYEQLEAKLREPAFLPRKLFERFKLAVLTTTDAPADPLVFHRQIRASGWPGRVIPCFRPDALFEINAPAWKSELTALEKASGMAIGNFRQFISSLENRRAYFKQCGAVSTDQGIESPYTHYLSASEIETIFQHALRGSVSVQETCAFQAHMLMEMARMSIADGLVMQIHAGVMRNHNRLVFEKFGINKGCDIPVTTEFTRNLAELLNIFGNDPRLTLVVFTADESPYARELAPLAGHYPALKLGAAWWFHDSLQGMLRFREQVSETASIYNTVGFTDDTRAFPSIPARHDLSRRVDATFLARQVTRHIIDMDDAQRMIKALAYELPWQVYKLG